MTSLAHDPTDNEADGQQRSKSQMQTLSENGISHAGIGTQNVRYETAPQLGIGHAMAPFVYPCPNLYYGSIFAPYYAQPYPPQPYGGHPMVYLQLMGVQQTGVPLPTGAIGKTVFVNAKQYHGILRRRQSRAKAESKNKASRNRKPYLHESRHLDALRRARGCGGRFLSSKKNENEQDEVASTDKSQSNINLNSDKNDIAPSNKTS